MAVTETGTCTFVASAVKLNITATSPTTSSRWHITGTDTLRQLATFACSRSFWTEFHNYHTDGMYNSIFQVCRKYSISNAGDPFHEITYCFYKQKLQNFIRCFNRCFMWSIWRCNFWLFQSFFPGSTRAGVGSFRGSIAPNVGDDSFATVSYVTGMADGNRSADTVHASASRESGEPEPAEHEKTQLY